MGLYIETRVRADLEEVWARTQDPALHQRWDLRFTEIDYLPHAEGEPQRFRYATRVLPGLTVAGTGVSAGEKERPDGTRTSALRFASPHPLSLIAEGSGYWRYVPDGEGVRFLTGYDYRPRWGRPGTLADRALFRPLMGWATAWSFDRLRLWLERDITPERALRRWLAEAGVRGLTIVAACAGLVCGALADPAGVPAQLAPLALFATPVLAVSAVLAALLVPPLPGTPSARRCLRTAPARARAPRLLATLKG
ncbi:hypothetical protein [Streptomyces deccanensis]|uniref:hypothetical protein n=1 Tax=Streptomyces deccanensis TaxID=424188 RepID=UPI001EFB2C3D|nr:hypothetical protein [Streptomyces deccanensis]ULR53434.1 hypothetical protein L3078_31465 [Streptomyces deccanensis]